MASGSQRGGNDGGSGGSPSDVVPVAPVTKSMAPTMLGSALSGMLARIPCHPLDTCKSRLQVQDGKVVSAGGGRPFKNVFDALVRTARAEGFAGLYRGFGITFLGSAPASCLYFTTYEASKRLLEGEQYQFMSHFVGGMVAESVSCVLWVPIDVVKERMQIQRVLKRPRAPVAAAADGATGAATVKPPLVYRNGVHALQSIVKSEGVVGLYRGYGATLLSFGPFSALFFMMHEEFKKLGARVTGSESNFGLYAASGAAAGGAASFLTNPLDVVKLRLQVQRGMVARGETPAFSYRNVFHGLSSLYRLEGVAGLMRGVGARVLFHAPATAVSISLFETCRDMVGTTLGYEGW